MVFLTEKKTPAAARIGQYAHHRRKKLLGEIDISNQLSAMLIIRRG
jgi:hypothetical protein